MHLSSEDVAQIVQEVWSSMLGLEIELAEAPVEHHGPAVAGSVGVSGATDCLISVELTEDGARSIGASMFMMGPDEVSDDDVSDAVGELTNMIGGNIKSLLPEPSTLSLPVVAHGKVPTLKVIGGKPLLAQTFLTANQPVYVNVWHRPQHSS